MIEVEIPELKRRADMFALVEACLPYNSPAHFPVTQHFAPGLYGREVLLPAGMLAIGKIHKTGHISVISKGHGVFHTENGSVPFAAPHTFVSPPGVMRAVHAITDVIWTTFHATDAVGTPDEMKAILTVERFEDLPTVGHNRTEVSQ
jgi:hypothetical protein